MHRQDGLLQVFSFEQGVDQVLLVNLVGDRFRSKVCWVLKVVRVAAPEARKRIISTLAQSKREKKDAGLRDKIMHAAHPGRGNI